MLEIIVAVWTAIPEVFRPWLMLVWCGSAPESCDMRRLPSLLSLSVVLAVLLLGVLVINRTEHYLEHRQQRKTNVC